MSPAGPLDRGPDLDGDCVSCPECGSTRLVATERVDHRYVVLPIVDLPTGGQKPVLRLRHTVRDSAGIVVRCAECDAVLPTDDFDTREI